MSQPGQRSQPVLPWPDLISSELLPVTDPVFHYTDSSALVKMAQNKRLWASQATSLNDKAEVIQGWKRIRKILRSLKKSDSGAKTLLNFIPKSPRASAVFILCASLRGDDANQWRLYGSGGHGYSVELDSAAALAVAADKDASIRTTTIGISIGDAATVSPWLPVIYSDDKLAAVLREMAKNSEQEEARISRPGVSREGRDHEGEVLGEQIAEALAGVAHLIKSPGFAGENEARVVSTLDWGLRHMRFRGSDRGVVGYVELATAPQESRPGRVISHDAAKDNLPIRSVRQGPLVTSREHGWTIRSLFAQNGVKNIDRKKSKVPLR